MIPNDKHMTNLDPEHISNELLRHLDIKFPSDKAEAWNSIESKISDPQKKNLNHRTPGRIFIGMAASIAVMLVTTAFLRYYTVHISTDGNSLSVALPDNSNIELYGNSNVSYNPLWWRISRNLQLNGDAEFKVTKGKRFRVVSENGITEVLGTSFRILSLDDTYKVSCYSGSVRITDPVSDVSATITANEKAVIVKPGIFEITLISEVNKEKTNESEFITFKNLPVTTVFSKLEERFGVIIEMPEKVDRIYSGNLNAGLSIKEVLYLVCLPLELEYVQLSENRYLVRTVASKQ